MKHAERKHSKFAPSAAERWFECPGSVELSEGLPDKSSIYAEEGTRAHEILEMLMQNQGVDRVKTLIRAGVSEVMINHAKHAADFIYGVHTKSPGSELLFEKRIYLSFIDPDFFGSYDGAVIDYFGTLHVFDYKYGIGHHVSPKENLQMIAYGIGLAHNHHWNFKKVRLWIIQPRVKGYDGPAFWEISIGELRDYVKRFRLAVERVKKEPKTYVEGRWCYWCRAQSKCPIKLANKEREAKLLFTAPVV